jgi:hypothetical protein
LPASWPHTLGEIADLQAYVANWRARNARDEEERARDGRLPGPNFGPSPWDVELAASGVPIQPGQVFPFQFERSSGISRAVLQLGHQLEAHLFAATVYSSEELDLRVGTELIRRARIKLDTESPVVERSLGIVRGT